MKTFRYYVYFMNEAVTVQFTSGFLKRMEIPRFMKGFVKSMTFSLHRWDSIIFICSYLKQPRWESKYIYVVISTCWSENQQWYKLDNSKLGSTQQWMTLTSQSQSQHVARIISSQKIYGLYGLKHHIVEMRWDVTMRDGRRQTTEDRATQPMEAGGWVSQLWGWMLLKISNLRFREDVLPNWLG